MLITPFAVPTAYYTDLRSKYRGCLGGLAIGDALGFLVGGKDAATCANFSDLWIEGKPIKPNRRSIFTLGQVSQETRLSRTLAESIIAHNGVDRDEFLALMVRDYVDVKYIGLRERFLETLQKARAGADRLNSVSRISRDFTPAIRTAPAALAFNGNIDDVIEAAIAQTEASHLSRESLNASVLTALAISMTANIPAGTLDSMQYITSLRAMTHDVSDRAFELVGMLQDFMEGDEATALRKTFDLDPNPQMVPHITGFAFCAPLYAIYCLLCHPTDIRSALAMAVRAGGEVSAVAALTGALVGAHMGEDAIDCGFVVKDRNAPVMPEMYRLADQLLDLRFRPNDT